jgi:hypothetical protein
LPGQPRQFACEVLHANSLGPCVYIG